MSRRIASHAVAVAVVWCGGVIVVWCGVRVIVLLLLLWCGAGRPLALPWDVAIRPPGAPDLLSQNGEHNPTCQRLLATVRLLAQGRLYSTHTRVCRTASGSFVRLRRGLQLAQLSLNSESSV